MTAIPAERAQQTLDGAPPDDGGHRSAPESGVVRLGWVQACILDEVRRRGGLAPRHALLDALFPKLGARPSAGAGVRAIQRLERWEVLRADAESSISRAISSLRQKGLLITESSGRTGRTLLRSPDVASLPSWVEAARREEDMAADCRRLARELERLAMRARGRAKSIRAAGSDAEVRAERAADRRRRRQLAVERA